MSGFCLKHSQGMFKGPDSKPPPKLPLSAPPPPPEVATNTLWYTEAWGGSPICKLHKVNRAA